MLILASGSPRRRELLTMLGYHFLQDPAGIDETLPGKLSPKEAVEWLSARKAEAAAQKHPKDVVLAADTLVACGEQILGIPADKTKAKYYLNLLSGRFHNVYTGCTIKRGGECKTFSVAAAVEFYPLSEEEIDGYLATGEPFDKAGGYGIQGRGSVLVKEIHGDFYTIMGLPVSRVVRELYRFGVVPEK